MRRASARLVCFDLDGTVMVRHFVQSQEGKPAVAALFYTGYPFRAELLGLTSGNPPN